MGTPNLKLPGGEPSPALIRHITLSQLITEIGATVRLGIKGAVAVSIAYFAYRSAATLAGKVTFASLIVAIFGGKKIACSIAYIFGGGGIFYGWRHKRHTERVIKQFAPFKAEAERQIDLYRDSSGLDERGRTPREDDL